MWFDGARLDSSLKSRIFDFCSAYLVEPGGLSLLEPRLMDSHSTVIIPFDDRVVFVRSLHCAHFSSRLSEVAQTLDPISGIDFLVGAMRGNERWTLGTV
jgi:hypothetical protein